MTPKEAKSHQFTPDSCDRNRRYEPTPATAFDAASIPSEEDSAPRAYDAHFAQPVYELGYSHGPKYNYEQG
eukprot:CAMPEP_0185744208 /NCGR_PEP_ID=MMETSP1174-20130828/2254_1 /TAXON_ID=35687 /ORGANISM="Dictyocha speculum, Strain CCMP1381" /LENGTH=70 /DNA_ID=CAMNT_0028417461 /DNA_START=484 /DNA_END=695 /DNA_ORIENTATION=+